MHSKEATIACQKAVRQHYWDEAGECVIFLREISSGYCTQNILIEIGSVFTELFYI